MPSTLQFEKSYNNLNHEQKRAVDTVEGAVMVIAGPGTGKTQILTLRIANILLKTDTTPETILALTFTESAVLSMRKRLVEIIGSEGYKVNITTFHGFCNEVIKNHPESFRHLADSQPITELEQIQILEEILLSSDLNFLKPFGDPIYYTKSILGAINDLKKEGIGPLELEESVTIQQESFEQIDDLFYDKGPYKGKMKGKYADIKKQISKNRELIFIYRQYQNELSSRKFYDYSDMIMEVAAALESDESLLLSLQEKYLYILVDEHQDTNSAQNKILEKISSYFDNPNLFIVGDEKQAIYRFQGASLENFLYFKKLYPQALLINLTHNYRSTQMVLDASGSLIEKNIVPEEFSAKSIHLLSTVDYPSEKISVARLSSPYAEMRFVAADIYQKIEDGTQPNEIAVIYRNNKDAFAITETLDQLGVAYYIESDQDLLSDREVQKLLDIFAAVEHFGDDYYIIPLMHMDFFMIHPMDIFKIIKFTAKHHSSIYDFLGSPENEKGLILENRSAISSLYNKLCEWQKLSKNDAIENVMIAILQDSGMLKKILESGKSLEKLDRLASIYQEMRILSAKKQNPTLTDFLNYIRLLEDHQLLIKRPLKTPLIKSVRLMTAHRSKGLEFEHVYIIQAYDGHWGNKKHAELIKLPWEYLNSQMKLGNQVDMNEDERRLFYVAMTRAKKSVTITYSQSSIDGKEQLPSQFLEEISPDYKQELDVSDFENSLKENPEIEFHIKNEKPDFKDKDFFNFIFFQEGLSVTGLNNYLKCPWKFFYSNLIQIPFIRERQLVYGVAIHESVCGFLNYNAKLKNISDQKAKEILIKYYEDALKKEPLYLKDYEELLEKGKNTLTQYYDFSLSKISDRKFLCEYEIKGIPISEKVKINGRIDKIELIPNSRQIIIYDLKTGKPKTRNTIIGKTQGGSGDYFRQILFYKLLVDGNRQKDWVAKKGIIEFVEADDKGNYHQEEFYFEPDQLLELKKIILQVSEEIINLEFWDKRCSDKECKYCRLRDMLTI